MATYADLTVDGNDIAGIDFDPSRASAVIEFGGDDGVIEAIVVDGTTFRLGSRREKPDTNGIVTFTDLVTTNSASNPATFYYRVRFTYIPKGSRKQGHDEWASGWFPLTEDKNLAAIPEAWDNVAAPVSWRSDFRDEMDTKVAAVEADRTYVEGIVITDLGTTDGQTKALVETPSSLTAQALSATFVSGLVTRGAGIDPTGVAPSSTALQALVDSAGVFGADVYLADGEYNLTTKLTVSGTRQRLYGPGVLKFTAGITNTPAVEVTGAGAALDGVKITNPNSLGTPTGAASFGVNIKANGVRVTGCTVDGFESGIAVDAGGEFVDWVIANNHVLNVKGAGEGPANTTSTHGENKGDGIVSWGGRGTITGNVVTAAPGADARVGIHVEALTPFATTHPAHEDALVAISGNSVSGKFRRGIVTEAVDRVAITGNSVADATWWAIAASTCAGTTIVGNTIHWTRQASDNQGEAWTPTRAPIMVLGTATGTIVANNVITLDGVAEALIVVELSGGTPTETSIGGNVVTVVSGSATDGIAAGSVAGLTVIGNRIAGFTQYGLYAAATSDLIATGNYLAGTTADRGIVFSGAASAGTIASNNAIDDCEIGVEAVNTSGCVISGNRIKNAPYGIELFGTTNTKALGNVFVSVTNQYANSGGAGVVTS